MEVLLDYLARYWRQALEILILWVAIYHGWLYFRGTRGAKVLVGLALVGLTVMLFSQFFRLPVIDWLFRNLTTILLLALVVIFQPELRRALAALGSNRILSFSTQSKETVEVLTDLTFELANRQLGALIAIERDSNLESFAESGVEIDCKLSTELVVTIFYPKTPLHDGGLIIRDDRIVAAACVLPLSQRVDLDRNLGLRHRAGLGLSEESDAVIIVVSEETGIVSICQRGKIERNFDPETFRARLGELLLLKKNHEASGSTLVRENRQPRSRRGGVGGNQEEHRDDRLAF
ncbi:MAG: TIGR00159 family protein [Verrucomicrobiaceae bacterium]|nr:MAG: TIGR00159 family protein [Verrucomicrobiaceae bacterium]